MTGHIDLVERREEVESQQIHMPLRKSSHRPKAVHKAVQRGNGQSRSQSFTNGLGQPSSLTPSVSLDPTSIPKDKSPILPRPDTEDEGNFIPGPVGEAPPEAEGDSEGLGSDAQVVKYDNAAKNLYTCSETSGPQKEEEKLVRKLTSAKLYEITSSPEFLPRHCSLEDPDESILNLSDQESGPSWSVKRQENTTSSNIHRKSGEGHDQDSSENPKAEAVPNSDGAG